MQGTGVGGTYVQVWDRTGVPTQPAGDEAVTVLVCVPFDWQTPQAEYVNDVQVVTGGTYVQGWDSTGVPVHPAGVADTTPLTWVLSGLHAPHASYVYVQG